MDAKSSPSFPFSFILFFIISIIIVIPQNSLSSFNGLSSCNNQISCGNLTNVGFPFWADSRPDGCGYPHLCLECDQNITTIDIVNVKYQVLELNLSTQILKLARSDLLASCPSTSLPTVLDPTLFEYAPGYGNINVSYDCSSGVFTPCSTSGTNFSSTETRSEQNVSCSSHTVGGTATQNCNTSSSKVVSNQYGSSCSSSMTIGVSNIYDDTATGNHSRIQEALREGFEVKYKVDTEFCSGCSGSGGVCGYGLESMKPTCYCTNQVSSALETCLTPSPKLTSGPSFKRNLAIAVVVGIIILSIVFIFICYKRDCILVAIFWNKDGREDVDALLKDESFAPQKYSYSDIKRMTNSLSKKIGNGGFGTVYKGKLPNGRLVAVKILSKSKDEGQGFVNEVRIGKTNHVNVISLLGFCYEGTKRVLVYEYMPKGSLDNFIPKKLESSNTSCQLEWKKMYEIALGIARGLEYLHKYCGTTILHFDIKPQNILLDEDFCPKVSDFGLSKLSQKKETSVPVKNPGGTPGFIAPEAIFRRLGEVSHKYDVYSYGMLVFNMVGGRNNVGPKVSDISSGCFPDSIYQDLELDTDLRILETKTEEEKQIARKMVMVGFWCIQRNPTDRPAMSKVIEMLEGDLHSVQIPPKPDWSSPERSPLQSTNLYTAEGSFLS